MMIIFYECILKYKIKNDGIKCLKMRNAKQR